MSHRILLFLSLYFFEPTTRKNAIQRKLAPLYSLLSFSFVLPCRQSTSSRKSSRTAPAPTPLPAANGRPLPPFCLCPSRSGRTSRRRSYLRAPPDRASPSSLISWTRLSRPCHHPSLHGTSRSRIRKLSVRWPALPASA